MSDIGVELGATTGRQRRCGWLDLVMLKYACMINGVTQLIMTKADVLADFETIKVAVAYVLKDGTPTFDMPENLDDVVEVGYVEFDSWPAIRGLNDAEDIPKELKKYILFIQKYLGLPISIVSTGPDREEIIFLDK
jgi:adenylosuccinate synthase